MNRKNKSSFKKYAALAISLVLLLSLAVVLFVNQKSYTRFSPASLPLPSQAEIDSLKQKYADVLNPISKERVLFNVSKKIVDSSGSYSSYYSVNNLVDTNPNNLWITNRLTYLDRYVSFDLGEPTLLDSVSVKLNYVSSAYPFDLGVICLDNNNLIGSAKVSYSDSYKTLNIKLDGSKCQKVKLNFAYNGAYSSYRYYFYTYVYDVQFTGMKDVSSEVEVPKVSKDGLVVYYDFNDKTAPVKDLSGNNNGGIVKGSIDFSSGYANIPYSGAYGYHYIDTTVVSDGKQIRTISYWVNFKDLARYPYQVSGLRYGPYMGYWNSPSSGINFRWGYGSGIGDTLKVLTSNSISPIKSGEWHMLTSTIEDIGNGRVKINGYIDGKKVNSQYSQYNGASAVLANSAPYTFFVGAANTYGTAYYPIYGGIDEFMIYNRALTDSEISSLFVMGR